MFKRLTVAITLLLMLGISPSATSASGSQEISELHSSSYACYDASVFDASDAADTWKWGEARYQCSIELVAELETHFNLNTHVTPGKVMAYVTYVQVTQDYLDRGIIHLKSDQARDLEIILNNAIFYGKQVIYKPSSTGGNQPTPVPTPPAESNQEADGPLPGIDPADERKL